MLLGGLIRQFLPQELCQNETARNSEARQKTTKISLRDLTSKIGRTEIGPTAESSLRRPEIRTTSPIGPQMVWNFQGVYSTSVQTYTIKNKIFGHSIGIYQAKKFCTVKLKQRSWSNLRPQNPNHMSNWAKMLRDYTTPPYEFPPPRTDHLVKPLRIASLKCFAVSNSHNMWHRYCTNLTT